MGRPRSGIGSGRADLHAVWMRAEVAGPLAGLEGVRYANVAVDRRGIVPGHYPDPRTAARLATNRFSYAVIETKAARRAAGRDRHDRKTRRRSWRLTLPLTLWSETRDVDVKYDTAADSTGADVKDCSGIVAGRSSGSR